VRETPFFRILAIYGVALFFLLLWPASTRPITHSAKTILRSLCRAFQVEYVSADRLRDADVDSDMPVRDHETIQKSFSLAAARKSLEVDNVFGSIEVVGGPSDQVQLVVNKTIRAESKDALAANRHGVPYLIVRGRMGGSAMTAAAVNALARAGL